MNFRCKDTARARSNVGWYHISKLLTIIKMVNNTDVNGESRTALFSIKYVYTLVFLNFIITVIFSDCVSDPLNVQIPKLWTTTTDISVLLFVCLDLYGTIVHIVILVPWSWCYFWSCFLFRIICTLSGILSVGLLSCFLVSSIPTRIIDINFHQLPTFWLQRCSLLQGTFTYNTGNTT